METGTGPILPQKRWLHFISPIFVQAFTLTFLAEWGDRSQLTTIVLAAREVSGGDGGYKHLYMLPSKYVTCVILSSVTTAL